ncbi:MAG: DUF2190 family protein [Phycisphaerales bacterium]|nr:DUF2190 family protein [Phycisphaerales bacterium]
MNTKHANGMTMPWVNDTGSTVASGGIVDLGTRIGIAITEIKDGETGDLALNGVHRLPSISGAGNDFTQMDALYFDSGAGNITDVVGANTPAGFAFQDKPEADTTVLIRLTA